MEMSNAVKAITLVLMSLLFASNVHAENDNGEFILLPNDEAPIAKSSKLKLNFGRIQNSLSLGVLAPLKYNGNKALLYDIGISSEVDSRFSNADLNAHVGLIWRKRASDDAVFGFNAYLDTEKQKHSDDFLGLASIGVEYEKRFFSKKDFLQLGSNAYVPFEDYTDRGLSSAPRLGVDLYASFGRDFHQSSLRATSSLFGYNETATANELYGYRADIEFSTSKFLPDGISAAFGLGVRGDNRSNSNIDVIATAALHWTFGRNTAVIPEQDCSFERDGNSRGVINCEEHVLADKHSDVRTKENRVLAVNESLSDRAQPVRVNAPRRHIGFGNASTPIEYKTNQTSSSPLIPANVRVVLVVEEGPLSPPQTFTWSASGMDANLIEGTISNVVSNSDLHRNPVSVTPGQYEITLTSTPTIWAFVSSGCTGRGVTTVGSSGINSVNISLDEDAQAVCVFTISTFG